MTIELKPRNKGQVFIRYTGQDFQDYLRFTALLGDAPSKHFDSQAKSWYCDQEDAKKIQLEIDGKIPAAPITETDLHIGDRLKLKPYDYQREAIAFGLKKKHALIQLPCGSGKILPFGVNLIGDSE